MRESWFSHLSEVVAHQAFCSLHEHVQNLIFWAWSNSSGGQSFILDASLLKTIAYAFSCWWLLEASVESSLGKELEDKALLLNSATSMHILKVLNHASRTLPHLPYTNLKKSCTEKNNWLLSMCSRDSLEGK